MSRRDVLMESLAATPRDLARLLRPVDDRQARRPPAEGQWCLAEIVSHLNLVEQHFLVRLRRVVAEENPRVQAIGPDPAAHDQTSPLAALVEEFAARRAATRAFLAGLDQRDWGRPLIHEQTGPSRLRDQVQVMVTHDNEHLAEIVAVRGALETV
jgi:uncharacterized damage-inducible protein DinB